MRAIVTVDREDAEAAIAAMRDALSSAGAEVPKAVLAVADAHGDLIALLRIDGAPASSIAIASNKAWTAAREGVTTRSIGTQIKSADRGFDVAYYGDPRYVGWGGGLPVIVNGSVVGAVAVSGLPEEEDERFAAIGVAAIERRLR